MAKQKMTTEEAFIKILQMHGIDSAFGIIGSAMMPAFLIEIVNIVRRPRECPRLSHRR